MYNFRKLRKINVFELKSSHLFDDFLFTLWHFMGICKCFFITRVNKAISSTFSARRNSLNMHKSVSYPLINNICLQLHTNYHFWPKKLLKRWLNLNLKSLIRLESYVRYRALRLLQRCLFKQTNLMIMPHLWTLQCLQQILCACDRQASPVRLEVFFTSHMY